MKIVFLNIWDCNMEKGAEGYLTSLVEDTEIICLQEASHNTINLCKNIFFEYRVISDHKHVSVDDEFHQATYVNNKIELIDHYTLLNNLKGTGLATHIQIRVDNKLINICNVHGISRPGNKLDTNERIGQSQELISAYESKDGLKIIGGDFNLERNTDAVALFEKNGYTNLIREYNIPTTRNRLIWDKYPNNKQYYSDYVFIKNPINTSEISLKAFSVIQNEVSDHLPMVLELNI